VTNARPGQDADAPRFIALIERCWADYPGCVLDIDAEAPELRALATYYAGRGGALWIAGDGAGMIAVAPSAATAWEICRLYVDPAHHGAGLAATLLGLAECHAEAAGATDLLLWTDTRFARAHRFYAKQGYTRADTTRDLNDLAATTEYRYDKPVGPGAVSGPSQAAG